MTTVRGTLAVLSARYERLSMRERALIAVGVLAIVLLTWDSVVMRPLGAHESQVRTELEGFLSGAGQAESTGALEAATAELQHVLERERALESELARLQLRLAAADDGLIEPKRMVEVVREVLSRQHRLTLISLRNGEVRPLLPTGESAAQFGPFMHPLELVVEGDYFSILAYLRELERLPWRLHWQRIDVQTDRYPISRVRIELSTLGMERAWLGV